MRTAGEDSFLGAPASPPAIQTSIELAGEDAGAPRAPRNIGLFVIVGGVIFVLLATARGPLHSALELGGDECFEVNKAFLWANGYAPYKSFWNDQPPLHTAMLTLLFKLFGPNIAVARAFALALGLLLLSGFFVLVKKRCGLLVASVGTLFFLCAPQVLLLSVSVMLEGPAIGAALWSLWLIYRWKETQRWHWLAAAGVLMACALQIKLTAAVVGPALAVEVALARVGRGGKVWEWQTLRNLLWFGASAGLAFIVIGLLLGNSFQLLWASHFSKDMVDELTYGEGKGFSFAVLWQAPELLYGAFIGLLIATVRQDWRRLAFPVAMLATVTMIHLDHRPWWSYYYLHFAVPLAWLTGHAAAEMIRAVRSRGVSAGFELTRLGTGAAACALFALLLVYGGSRFVGVTSVLLSAKRVEDSALVANMRRFASRTHWVYTRGDICPFHARLRLVPDLAVIPAKRVWSGRLSAEEALAAVKKYRPEQMMVRVQELPLESGIRELADSDYTLVCQEAGFRLYVANSIVRQRE